MSLALSGGQSAEAQKEIEDGFIVVETNYRVGAPKTRQTPSMSKSQQQKIGLSLDGVWSVASVGTRIPAVGCSKVVPMLSHH